MRELGELIGDGIGMLRTASPVMLALRLLLLVSCGVTIWVVIASAPPYLLSDPLMVVAIGCLPFVVVRPDSLAAQVLLIDVILMFALGGRHTVGWTLTVTGLVALVHTLTTLCSRGPLHARPHRGSFSLRHWLWWAVVSCAAVGVVLAVAVIPSGTLPRGFTWVALASLATVLAVAAVLRVGLPQNPPDKR